MAVVVANSRFWIPREGAGSILQAVKNWFCTGCPISVGGEPPADNFLLILYSNDVEITDASKYADFTQIAGTGVTLNDETGPTYCLGHVQGPDVQVDGEWAIIFDQEEIPIAAAVTVYGAMLYSTELMGNALIAVSRFDVPVTFTDAGTLKHTGTLPLLPQVPLLDV